jgi:hypothetical protein
MNAKDFHADLMKLVKEASVSQVPVLTITGIMECVKTDIIYRSIRAAEMAELAAQMGQNAALANDIVKDKGMN